MPYYAHGVWKGIIRNNTPLWPDGAYEKARTRRASIRFL